MSSAGQVVKTGSTVSPTIECIVKTYLPKTAKKNWRHILCDVKAVSLGIKPSFLYDHSSIEPAELSEMVNKLASADFITESGNLRVLSLGRDVFLANMCCLREVVERTCTNLVESKLVVDVSAKLKQPELLDKDLSRNLKDQTCDLLTQVKESADKSTPIHKLISKPDWNISTTFGILLGYPAFYWYSDTEMASNCLSMVPLRVFKVTTDLNRFLSVSEVDISKQRLSSAEYFIYSFSVPEVLVSSFEDLIDDWFRKIQGETSYQLQITSDTVTLPAVAL